MSITIASSAYFSTLTVAHAEPQYDEDGYEIDVPKEDTYDSSCNPSEIAYDNSIDLKSDSMEGAILRKLRKCLNAGGDVNKTSDNECGATALFRAARHNWVSVANLLIQNGANVKFKNSCGVTAMTNALPQVGLLIVQKTKGEAICELNLTTLQQHFFRLQADNAFTTETIKKYYTDYITEKPYNTKCPGNEPVARKKPNFEDDRGIFKNPESYSTDTQNAK